MSPIGPLRILVVLWFPVLAFAGPAKVPTPTPAASTPSGFEVLLAKFEKEVAATAAVLKELRSDRIALESDIAKLKEESVALHRRLDGTPNVIVEVRLKAILGDLRKKLSMQSALQQRWDALRREYEEKALSLLSLYNDRIENRISGNTTFMDAEATEKVLLELVETTRKRQALQASLDEYRRENPGTNPASSWDLEKLPPSRDREGLLLTMRLLKDRRREIEDRYERSILREEEILKEIRLRERLREFMDDIERMRGDSSSSTKQRDLDWVRGQNEALQLREQLLQIRKQREKDQFTLVQLDAYLDRLESRFRELPRRPGERP